jgi:hypothetical protein
MNFLSSFVKIQDQLRIFHWQTPSYAEHKAFGKAYDDLGDLIDSFIEVYAGKYGMPQGDITYKIELSSYNESYKGLIDTFIGYLTQFSEEIDSNDSDLLNIRDEMLAVLNRLKYLLTLS